MRLAFFLLLNLWALFAFSACGGLVDELRSDSKAVDDETDREAGELAGEYRPKTLRGLSANNVQSYDPPVTRGYGRKLGDLSNGSTGAVADDYKRVTKADFIDKEASENSLWDGQGQNNYLFSNNRNRQTGDLVTADVERELKREIQYQLWMTLPPDQRRVKRTPASETGDKATDKLNGALGAAKDAAQAAGTAAAAKVDKNVADKAKDAAEEAAKTNMASNGKDDDIVRMEVAETLPNGLVKVVGQKRVVYRGATKVVEVMALVNNKDIDDGNRVKSSAFLDMRTQVIQ